MKRWVLLGFVVAALNAGPEVADATEPGALVMPNPVDVSPAWRSLANQYKTQVDTLRSKRGDKVTEKGKIQDKLDHLDVEGVFSKSNDEVSKSAHEVFDSVGDAAVDYFKDFGEMFGLASSARNTTEALSSLKDEADSMKKPGETQREEDRLERNKADLDDEVKNLDRDIVDAQRNMDLSNQIADIYGRKVVTAHQDKQEVVFRLVDKSKRINQTAATNIQHHLDTVPAGWVQCNCPAVHRAYGRYIKGIFYHPSDPAIVCPNS